MAMTIQKYEKDVGEQLVVTPEVEEVMEKPTSHNIRASFPRGRPSPSTDWQTRVPPSDVESNFKEEKPKKKLGIGI